MEIERQLEKLKKAFKIYVLITITMFAAFFYAAFSPLVIEHKKFTEIDVERINIVEKNGDLKMVISNRERQHPGISNGKVIERESPRPPGILFFNQIGDEMGGLVYGENGENGHFGSLTWDKFRGDQTMGFRHLESSNGSYSSGLSMWQQPNIPGEQMGALLDSVYNNIDNRERRSEVLDSLRTLNLITTNRLFLGKGRNDSAVLIMHDIKGTVRLAIQVDAEGNPAIDFYDEHGEKYYSIPQNED